MSLRTRVKSKHILGIEAFIVTLISLARPIQVSYDSYLYLSSAKSLFSKDFEKWFHFLREPGYPFFLKVILEVGNNHLWLVGVVQSCLILFAVHAFLNQFFKIVPCTNIVSLGSRYLILLLVLGYGNAILQQAIFISFVGFVSAHLVSIMSTEKRDSALWGCMFFAFVASTLSVILAVALLATYFVIFTFKSLGNRSKFDLKYVLLVFTITLAVLGSWFVLKSNIDISKNTFQDKKFFWEYKYDEDGTALHLYRSLETLGGLVSATPETYSGVPRNPAAAENLIFGVLQDNSNSECLNLFPGPEKHTLYNQDVIGTSKNCLKSFQNVDLSFLGFFGKLLYPVGALGVIFFLILSVFRSKRLFTLALFPILLLFPYIYAGVGISRLGVTSILLAPLGLISFYLNLRLWLRPRRG